MLHYGTLAAARMLHGFLQRATCRQVQGVTQISIAGEVTELQPTALLAADGSVWLSVKLRWWDLATVLWWWLCPTDKRAWVTVTTSSGQRVRTRAIRIAEVSIHIGGVHRVK